MKNNVIGGVCGAIVLIVAALVFWAGYSAGESAGFFTGFDEGEEMGRRFVTCPDCGDDIPVLNPDGSAPTDDDIARIYGEFDPFK